MSDGSGIQLTLPPETLRALASLVAEVMPPPASVAEAWLDVDGAATYLACRRKRIYDLVGQRRLKSARDGRRLLFRREWLDAALDVDE